MRNKKILMKMVRYCEKIEDYCKSFPDCTDFSTFSQNIMLLEVCVFNLSQLGELVRHLDKEFMEKYGEIHWAQIYSLRNRIVHDYDGIDVERVWRIIQNDLPELKTKLNTIR